MSSPRRGSLRSTDMNRATARPNHGITRWAGVGVPTTVAEAVGGSPSGTTVSVPVDHILTAIIAGLIVAALVAAARAISNGLDIEITFRWPPFRSRSGGRPKPEADQDADAAGRGGG